MVVEAVSEEKENLKTLLKETMESVVELKVPLIADVHEGKIGQKQSKYWKDTTMYRIGLTGGVGSGKAQFPLI